jgi:hypothetical protein
MKILTTNSISDVQVRFQSYFPHLKLEFYTAPHKSGEGSQVSNQIDRYKKISDFAPHLKDITVNIDGEMTVKDFEDMMEKEYGLHVQVFRKSASLWLQTATTDHWTLSKQEGKGKRSEVFAK